MEAEPALRQSRPVVAFDFDGTLTVRDSYTAFLRWRTGTLAYGLGLASLAPAACTYLKDRDRGRLKAAATRRFLAGTHLDEVEAQAEGFAYEFHDAILRPDALACWREWGKRGARRIIVTASPALTVRPFAQKLGADDLVGTRLSLDSARRLTGAFASPNCRGPEKVARLQALLGEDFRLAAAYGDTSGDVEMLERADEKGWRVFTQRP